MKYLKLKFEPDFIKKVADPADNFEHAKFSYKEALAHEHSEEFEVENVRKIDNFISYLDILVASDILDHLDPIPMDGPKSYLALGETQNAHLSSLSKLRNIKQLQNYVLRIFLIKFTSNNVVMWHENSNNSLNLVVPSAKSAPRCRNWTRTHWQGKCIFPQFQLPSHYRGQRLDY